METADWILSEDSFLKVCCEIHEFDWGAVYDWPGNDDNTKLHFVRITQDGLDAAILDTIAARWRPHFERRSLSYCVKARDDLELSHDARSRLELWTPSLMFLRTQARASLSRLPDLQLVEVSSEADFLEWWCLYSTYPTREQKLRSPFFPYAKRYFENGTKFYLFKKDSEPVAGLALDRFRDVRGNEALNLWGVSVLERSQRQGVFKEFEARVLAPLGDFYLQVIEGSPLDMYYRSQGAATLLGRQHRYRWKEKGTI